ncbi:MAG TPA: PPOX class F420-dependent oxidoreductase [Nitrososphaeraceae archaeon]|nr:PPOX class F420-dependent oxidoreductase [Nitrososphaeraceae archaeon]
MNKNYNNLETFEKAKYINIQTYKKTGQPISTPVWFIIKDNKIFFRTSHNSGKIKRIRNNNNVKFALCDIRGKIKGEWYEGIAKIENDSDNSILFQINKKYGLSSRLMKIFYKIKKIDIVILSIEPKNLI